MSDAAVATGSGGTSGESSSHPIERVRATFDDPSLVADAGLILPATLMVRLGLESLINATVGLVGRVGGALPGRKVLTLVATVLAGGSHIDHADRLRAGATQKVLPFRVMAPSTLGTFLRSFTSATSASWTESSERRSAGRGRRRGPGRRAETIDLDSTICEVHGKAKHGAAYGYTRVLGYYPLVATRSDAGEVLHARLRKGSSMRGHTLRRGTRRPGAAGWGRGAVDAARRLGLLVARAHRCARPSRRALSVTVPITQQIRALVGKIDEGAWTAIDYPEGGEAQVAETVHIAGSGRRRRALRLVVRRSRLTDPAQLRLWPQWRHHAFVTDIDLPTAEVDRLHRDHATVELAIRDLKEGAGMAHCPSGRFFANAAWLGCAVLAHNLVRWTAQLGGVRPAGELTVARTVRSRLLALPGRLMNRSGALVLRLPSRWPWATSFTAALDRLRALPTSPG